MPTKPKGKKVGSKKTARPLTIHCQGKKTTIPNDAKATDKINTFVCDKMRLGSYQLVTHPDSSGSIVPLKEVNSFTGKDLWAIERNKAQ